jgi:hypothetical protein
MSDNASATYRGFRNQALYVLYRLLTDEAAADQIYRPESAEDLAIYQAGEVLIEAIQVKDYSSGLSLSAFKPESPKGFFARFQARRNQHPHCTTKLVILGTLGPELLGAIEGDHAHRGRVVAKLSEANQSLSPQDISTMLDALRGNVIHSNATNLLSAVSETLRDSAVAGDLNVTINLLIYWIFEASENMRDLTKDGLLKQLTRISVYLAVLRDNSAHWGSTIRSIEETSLDESQRAQLIAQYRRGVQARWEHILADADCVRTDRLLEIHHKIQSQPVVIVRGASGQGKSSLGWRYLRDFCPEGVRFHVRLVEGRQHALQIANALGDHVRKLNLQAVAYLDVAPADSGWTELVRELAVSGLKVLITVREEDFRRANIALGDFAYAEVVLEGITKEEAEPIFSVLAGSNESPQVDFEEAWSVFASGDQGPLLEFTYLAFAGESLDSRIASQVNRIQRDATTGRNDLTSAHIELLALASIAAETGASVNLESLCTAVELNPLLLPLNQLANEYLLQQSTDGSATTITGLHALRSRAVVKALFSEAPERWAIYAARVLPLIVDQDLGVFLLSAFSRHPQATNLLFENVCRVPLRSWTQAAAITGALLWEGVNRYEITNREVIARGISQFETAWWLVCDSHVGMPDRSGSDTVQLVQRMFNGEVPEIQLTPKIEVFQLFREWVGRASTPPQFDLNNHTEWPAAGDIAYWIGLVDAQGPLRTAVVNLLPVTLPRDTSIEELGLFIDGRSRLNDTDFQSWHSQNAVELGKRYIIETDSIHLEDDGSRIKVYFSISIAKNDSESPGSNGWHELTMRRVRLLRLLFPKRDTYCSQGVGLEVFEHLTGHDPTTKEIPSASLPPERSVRLNAQFINLVSYRHSRPETWNEYVDAVYLFRKEVSACFRKLHRGWGRLLSEVIPRRQSFTALPGDELDRLKVLSKLPLFPRACVDEWGFLSEQTNAEEKRSSTMQEVSLRRFDAWKKEFGRYETGVGQVTMKVLGLTQLFAEEHQGRIPNDEDSRNSGLLLINLAAAWESLATMQREFRVRFKRFYSIDVIAELEQHEQSNLYHLWPIAFAMVNTRHQRQSSIAQRLESEETQRRSRFLRSLDTEIAQILTDRGTIEVLEGSRLINRVPHLCIACDYKGLQAMEECSREIPAAIWRASQSGGWRSLEWKPLEIEWPRIAVISLIRGKAAAPACASLTSSVFFGTPSGFETQLHHYVRLPVDQSEFLALGYELWDSPLLRATYALMAGVQAFVMTNMRFCRLAEIIDQHGLSEEDQSRVLRNFGNELSEVLTTAQRSYSQLFEVLRVTRYRRSEEWIERLRAICQHLLIELEIDKPVSINPRSFLEWIGYSSESNSALHLVASEIMDFVTSTGNED